MKRHALKSAACTARTGEHLPLHARDITIAPASPGLYLLYRGHRLIYISLAAGGATIQEWLRYHLRGGSACTRAASQFEDR